MNGKKSVEPIKWMNTRLTTFTHSPFKDKGGQWRDFNIAPPLWVFLGKTVTGGKSAGEKETETDVIRIINFLAWAQSNRQQAVEGITKLISGTAGLVDENGAEIFGQSFPYIKGKKPQDIYDDLCSVVFRAKGQLTISHLTGMDELQLCAGDEMPFGVINVGDASGLYTKLESIQSPIFSLSKDAFSKPLFADVDNNNSPINIVIGARKNDWYELYISPEKLELSEYGRVREWETLAVDLICEYANQYWRGKRNSVGTRIYGSRAAG